MQPRSLAANIAAALVVGIVATVGALAWKGMSTVERITVGNPDTEASGSILDGSPRVPLRGEEDGRINILLLGRAGERHPGKNLTDTVMLASVDVEGRRAGFLSLPRDLYVPIPGTELSTKINSLYQYGLETGGDAEIVKAAVGDITGETIHYFASLDFDAFESMVDALDGVRVENPRDIHDTRYPGPQYSYETFDLKAGWHTLDGATALKYVRERHDDPEGDFGRARRQQQVLSALRDRILSPATLLNPVAISRFLDALGDGVRTDLTGPELESLARLAKEIDTRNVSSVVVDAWRRESLLRVDHVMVGPVRAFILVPRTGNWNEIRLTARELFETDARAKRLAAVTTENATVEILAAPSSVPAARLWAGQLVETYGFADVEVSTDRATGTRDRGIVVDRTGLAKPFALDTLVGTFDLERADAGLSGTDLTGDATDRFDFLVHFGDNLNDAATGYGTLGDDPSVADDPFSEYFVPQRSE